MGWKIFSHSVFLLNHNLRDALRISSPLIAMMILNLVLGGAMAIDNLESGAPTNTGSNLLLQLLTGVAGLWVAVAWHRFVLLEERGGNLPPFHGRRIFSYFIVLVALTFVFGISASALVLSVGYLSGAVFGVASAGFGLLYVIGGIALVLVFVWSFYRLSPLLPAAALGEKMGVRQAWEATSEISGAVLIAALLLNFFGMLSGAVAILIMFQVSLIIGVFLIGILQWAYTMVGISILTTIYGISVEGRDI